MKNRNVHRIEDDPIDIWVNQHHDIVIKNVGKHFAFDDNIADVIAIADDYATVRALAREKNPTGSIVFGIFSVYYDPLTKNLEQTIFELKEDLSILKSIKKELLIDLDDLEKDYNDVLDEKDPKFGWSFSTCLKALYNIRTYVEGSIEDPKHKSQILGIIKNTLKKTRLVENMNSMGIYKEAYTFAVRAHENQKYGKEPYKVHLDAVANLVQQLEDPFVENRYLMSIAYLHDVIEDTSENYESISSKFGTFVADAVNLISDPPGKNRKERKKQLHSRLCELKENNIIERAALIVKVADRLANVRACVGSGMIEMYKKEQYDFYNAAYRKGLCDLWWDEINKLLDFNPMESFSMDFDNLNANAKSAIKG